MTDQHDDNSLHSFLDGDATGDRRSIDDSARDVGKRIAEARAAAGRTQTEVANQLGVKESTIDRWERGSASPRSNRLTALAGILGVSLSWLLVGYGSEPTSAGDLDEISSGLNRVHGQLTDALNDVAVLMAQLDSVRSSS